MKEYLDYFYDLYLQYNAGYVEASRSFGVSLANILNLDIKKSWRDVVDEWELTVDDEGRDILENAGLELDVPPDYWPTDDASMKVVVPKRYLLLEEKI